MSQNIYSKIEALCGLIQSKGHAVPIKIRFNTATKRYLLFVNQISIHADSIEVHAEDCSDGVVQIPWEALIDIVAFTDSLGTPVFLNSQMNQTEFSSQLQRDLKEYPAIEAALTEDLKRWLEITAQRKVWPTPNRLVRKWQLQKNLGLHDKHRCPSGSPKGDFMSRVDLMQAA